MNNIHSGNQAGKYLENLLTGNRAQCSAIAREFLHDDASVINLYEKVFKIALYDIGRLWETNKITVAAEHLATAITEGVLNELFEQVISEKRVRKKVVAACVENEAHQVGIKMVADVFEMNGWESYFLGAGIPVNELVKFIDSIKPDVFALSLSVYFNFLNLERMLVKIEQQFPGLPIILGGQAISRVEKHLAGKHKNVTVLTDLYQLEQYIQRLNSN